MPGKKSQKIEQKLATYILLLLLIVWTTVIKLGDPMLNTISIILLIGVMMWEELK